MDLVAANYLNASVAGQDFHQEPQTPRNIELNTILIGVKTSIIQIFLALQLFLGK